MLAEGVIDRRVKFVPMLEGFQQAEHMRWMLEPFSHHEVGNRAKQGIVNTIMRPGFE